MKLNKESIAAAIGQLVESYQLEPAQVFDIAKIGIKAWFKKDYPEYKKADLFIDFNENGEVRILRRREIVEEVEDAETQMTLADAKEVAGDDMTVGEFVWSEVTPETMELSRIATIAAAQTITQNLKAVEKENFQTKFKDKEGKLLKAVVTKVAESNILLEIEGNPIILPPEGQIPQKKYTEGEEIFVFL